MNRAQRLREILRIAGHQRDMLACADLDAITELQEKRQQLQEGIQSLDECNPEEKELVTRIQTLDRETRLLLLAKLADTKEEMQKIGTLRRVMHSYRPTTKSASPRLSCHI